MIKTKTLVVNVTVDLNKPHRNGAADPGAGILHVTAHGVGAGSTFSVQVVLEPYRVEGAASTLGAGLCNRVPERADTIVTTVKDQITWYHYNDKNTSYFNTTVANQGVDPAAHPDLIDPFTRLAWGGSVAAKGLKSGRDTNGLAIFGAGLTTVDVAVTLLTLQPADAPSEASWLTALNALTPAPAPAPAGVATWDSIMQRSYIEVTAPKNGSTPPAAAAVTAAKAITDHVNWDRYLSLIQGRAARAPIKFNGQAFNCNNTGKGWDARDWGAGYWWQNTRQPYYNVLAQGDFDTMSSFLDFYLRMLPYVDTPVPPPPPTVSRCVIQFGSRDNTGAGTPPTQYGMSHTDESY